MWRILFFLPLTFAYRCINFYGLEVPQTKLVCSWVHNPEWYLDQVKDLIAIDSIRLPFSQEYITCNNDFRFMDEIIEACANRNISVILDYHRGYADHQGASPIEDGITEDMWLDTLLFVLQRYIHKLHVRAISIFNEFQGTNKQEIETIQRKAVLFLEDVFPKRYEYMVGCADWGKDCSGMWESLPTNNTYIEMHTYGFAPGKLPSNTQKLFVGELGWKQNETETFNHFKRIVHHRRIQNICLWTLAHSHDTDNLFQDDCITVNKHIQQGFNSLFESYKPQCLRGNKRLHA